MCIMSETKTDRLFSEYENEPLLMKFMGGMCGDDSLHRKYQESYKVALSAVREAVAKGAMDEEEGRRLMKKCRRA